MTTEQPQSPTETAGGASAVERVVRRVVCAAIRFGGDGGIVFTGARHYDSVMTAVIRGWPHRLPGPEDQGFIDQGGKFLTRQEAWGVACTAGQILRRCGGDEGKLFSENLY